MGFAVAVSLLVVLLAPASAQVPGTRAAALARDGWDAIDHGRPAAAETSFNEALALESRDPSLYLGAALAAHLQGASGRARPLLERALQINARYVPAAMLLGEVCYRLGDLPTAIRTYEQILEDAPAQAALRARLEAWRKEAALHSGFFQAPGAHFTVLFEGPSEERLAARALEVLEAAYWRVGTALGVFPADPITVVLYTQEQFRDVTRSPGWTAALYDGKIRVPMRGALDAPQELERVLTHELTHALVRAVAARNVPTWLNEGLAVAFEPSGAAWAEQQIGQASATLPYQRLSGSFEGFTDAEARVAYAQSAVTVLRMIDLGGAATVMALIADLGDGSPFEPAFERRLLMSFGDFVAQAEPRR